MTRSLTRSAELLAVALVLVLALVACSRSAPQVGEAPPSASALVPATGGAVTIIADAKGFTPSEIHATKGAPLSLIFKRTSDNTCAKEVVFPELKIRRPLPLGETVAIAMPTEIDRTYRFQCGMAMWEGSVVIK